MRGSRGDVLPERPAEDPGGAGLGVDGDAGDLVEADQHGVAEVAAHERAGTVAAALGRHARRPRRHTTSATLVGGVWTATVAGRWSTARFQGRAGGVVPGVAGEVDAAGAEAAEVLGGDRGVVVIVVLAVVDGGAEGDERPRWGSSATSDDGGDRMGVHGREPPSITSRAAENAWVRGRDAELEQVAGSDRTGPRWPRAGRGRASCAG